MIRRLLWWAFPVLHPIRTYRHWRSVNAPWKEMP